MTNYLIIFILTTQLTEEEKKANVEKVEANLTQAGATEVKTEIMGDRKL
ncbi:30S ribosomal protein S6, partial [Streptobacillus moniliformis]